MFVVAYTVLPQVVSEWIWMRQPSRTYLNKQVMPRVHSENGIMECSIPTILLVEDLIISMASAQDIGAITTMP